MMRRSFHHSALLSALALIGCLASRALAANPDAAEGKVLLENNCGRCHTIEAMGASPLPQASPLRNVYVRYPIDQLEQGFAEGMGSKHRDMPQIQFSPDQVAAILDYLGGITGRDPSQRQDNVIPGETPP